MAHPVKFSHAAAAGGRGVSGGRPSTSGDANGDGSRSPYTQGGSNIPLYAAGAGAGAANNHRNYHHHNGGDSKCSSIRSAALAATILEFLVLYTKIA